jgi:hypothetical protein
VPFQFQPLQVVRRGNEVELRGRLQSGAYFGPEYVIVRSRAGEQQTTQILSHALEFTQGWPVLPEHRETILILRIPAIQSDFEIFELTGIGTVAPGQDRIDVTKVLEEPEFWVTQGLTPEWFGLEGDAVEEWFMRRIYDHIEVERWPYVRVELPNSRTIELEMAGGAEHQDRVWIVGSGNRRVLLGYESGHFSRPGLRIKEVCWLAEQTELAVSNLLWLQFAYFDDSTDVAPLIEKLVARIPGLLPSMRGAVCHDLHDKMTGEGPAWTLDPKLGWINNGDYSQRNPASTM